MNRTTNGNKVAHIKRKAKKIKKELGVPHYQGLDLSAQESGHSNWKNVVNTTPRPAKRKRIKVILPLNVPKPSMLIYYSTNARMGAKRPNVKAPLQMHKQLGEILRELRVCFQYNKRALSATAKVQSTLDDWIQHEYPDKKELSDREFFQIYYGNHEASSTPWPTKERKRELSVLGQNARKLIAENYHDCTPIKFLMKQLDNLQKANKNWPLNKQVKFEREDRVVPKGKIVLLKSNKKPAVVISHDYHNDLIVCYADSGREVMNRSEITVPRKKPVAKFEPMRLFLPYGKWKCADGSEVLFNRDYTPIWLKSPKGKVTTIDLDTSVNFEDEPHFYYGDDDAPYYGNRTTFLICKSVLEDWKTERKKSLMSDALLLAIETGKTDVLKPKNRLKVYPAIS